MDTIRRGSNKVQRDCYRRRDVDQADATPANQAVEQNNAVADRRRVVAGGAQKNQISNIAIDWLVREWTHV